MTLLHIWHHSSFARASTNTRGGRMQAQPSAHWHPPTHTHTHTHAHASIPLSAPKIHYLGVGVLGRPRGEVAPSETLIFPRAAGCTAGVKRRRVRRPELLVRTPELSAAVCLPARCLLSQYISGDARHLDRRAPGIEIATQTPICHRLKG